MPIIAVTSYALSGDEAKARAAGCDGYVAKPFSPRQLLAKIREFLPDSRRRVSEVIGMRTPPLILIVDDVADNLEILQLRLESQGYEVITGRRWRSGARDASATGGPTSCCSTS